MKIKDIQHELLYEKDRLILTIDKKDRAEIISKLEALGSVDPDVEYDIKIEKRRKHRSKDANSYMWVLADKIADVIHSTKEEVYKSAIRDVGVYDDICIRNKAVASMVEDWSSRGLGWFTDTFDSKLKGCKVLRLYHGSSTYNTKEMSRLIDDMVEEARNLNIETATPDELKRMKSDWGGGYNG